VGQASFVVLLADEFVDVAEPLLPAMIELQARTGGVVLAFLEVGLVLAGVGIDRAVLDRHDVADRLAHAPVARDADRRSVQEFAATRADLVSRAREGKLQLQDLEDGTFTISNLGMYGVEQFIAVLNPPQVAILAVGSIEDRAVVVEGQLAVAPTMTMTLTCDHRAIDGSEGAEFLRTVKAFVESPALAL